MDASEYKRIFLPHNRRMYWVAWRLTGNAPEAEDLVQEAYLKLWTKRDQLGSINNTEAYCTTLVKNLFYDDCRRKHPEIADSPPDDLNIADESDTSSSLEHRDESSHVKLLIKKLPAQQRQIITLRDIDDLSYDEIETRTGINGPNIRVLLSRARKRIREQFKETLDYERK